MQLGKEQAAGFVGDDVDAAGHEAGLPPDGADAVKPERSSLPAPAEEPAIAG